MDKEQRDRLIDSWSAAVMNDVVLAITPMLEGGWRHLAYASLGKAVKEAAAKAIEQVLEIAERGEPWG